MLLWMLKVTYVPGNCTKDILQALSYSWHTSNYQKLNEQQKTVLSLLLQGLSAAHHPGLHPGFTQVLFAWVGTSWKWSQRLLHPRGWRHHGSRWGDARALHWHPLLRLPKLPWRWVGDMTKLICLSCMTNLHFFFQREKLISQMRSADLGQIWSIL